MAKTKTLPVKKPSSRAKKSNIAPTVALAGAAAVWAMDNEAQASQAGLTIKSESPVDSAALAENNSLAAAPTHPDFQVDIDGMLNTLERMFADASPGVDVDAIAEQLSSVFAQPESAAAQEQLPFEMLLAQAADTSTMTDGSSKLGDTSVFGIPTEGLIGIGLLGIVAAAGGGGGT